MRHSAWESHQKKSRVVEQLWPGLFSQFVLSLSLYLSLSLSLSFLCLLVALSLFRSHSSPNLNTPVSSSVALWPMCCCLLDCLVLEVFVLMSRHTFADWFGFSRLINPNTPFFPSIPGALLPPKYLYFSSLFKLLVSQKCPFPLNKCSHKIWQH